ncbi:MazG family protein [Pseudactinotalea suaedae]|uniref:MazG family protein n=1 Tax=Pseudactinotalea suaedae TaxID=1524924 RepID=UPI001F4F69B9|nr:MazG family protein [Pseudactinotalea suaedae]
MSAQPEQPQPVGAALLDAVAVMDRLRSPGGCPWDAEQTHASLAPYAIEEAHEVAEAAESGDLDALAEELGDLLLQVLFHARVASERSDGDASCASHGFDIDDVARGLVAKLTRRHPHVFADGAATTPDEVNAQWETIKADEKRRAHPLDDLPASLPALARAQKVVSRLRKAGTPSRPPSQDSADGGARLGAALLALVIEADAQGVDAEAALRAATRDLERSSRA